MVFLSRDFGFDAEIITSPLCHFLSGLCFFRSKTVIFRFLPVFLHVVAVESEDERFDLAVEFAVVPDILVKRQEGFAAGDRIEEKRFGILGRRLFPLLAFFHFFLPHGSGNGKIREGLDQLHEVGIDRGESFDGQMQLPGPADDLFVAADDPPLGRVIFRGIVIGTRKLPFAVRLFLAVHPHVIVIDFMPRITETGQDLDLGSITPEGDGLQRAVAFVVLLKMAEPGFKCFHSFSSCRVDGVGIVYGGQYDIFRHTGLFPAEKKRFSGPVRTVRYHVIRI